MNILFCEPEVLGRYTKRIKPGKKFIPERLVFLFGRFLALNRVLKETVEILEV